METLAQFVKRRRKQLKLSQVDLAKRAGTGLRFIRDLEQNKANLSTQKVNQVLQLFGHQLGAIPIPRETFKDENP